MEVAASTSAAVATVMEGNASGSELPKTVLRLKRRLEESPSKVLYMSYKRCKQDEMVPAPEQVNTVFHLAGTINKDKIDNKSIAETIKDALNGVDQATTEFEENSPRKFKYRSAKRRYGNFHDKTKEDTKQQAIDSRFKLVSQRRGMPVPEDDNKQATLAEMEESLLFNLLDLVEENESSNPPKRRPKEHNREVGSVTVNGVPMIRDNAGHPSTSVDMESAKDGFVYDLYVTKGPVVEEHIHDQFVSVRRADGDYEFDFESYGSEDEHQSQGDDDSNDEDNWRNDYPDSDPDHYVEGEDSYRCYGQNDEELLGTFAGVSLGGHELSSDDDGDFIYSTENDGIDDGLGGMYHRYKARLRKDELSEEVVSVPSESDED